MLGDTADQADTYAVVIVLTDMCPTLVQWSTHFQLAIPANNPVIANSAPPKISVPSVNLFSPNIHRGARGCAVNNDVLNVTAPELFHRLHFSF